MFVFKYHSPVLCLSSVTVVISVLRVRSGKLRLTMDALQRLVGLHLIVSTCLGSKQMLFISLLFYLLPASPPTVLQNFAVSHGYNDS